MQQFRPHDAALDANSDRRPIRLDYPPRQEGIAAALRRAFAAAAQPTGDDEFETLLAKLN